MLESLGQEKSSIIGLLGNLGDLKVELNVTNITAYPVSMNNRPIYWCCLTRIDSVKASLGQESFEISVDRDVRKEAQSHIDTIAGHVASRLHIKPDSAEAQPADEEELDVLVEGGDEPGA